LRQNVIPPNFFGTPRTPHADKDDTDFTIVIAHRGQAMGLWATIHSCEIDLLNSGFKYNYVLVCNGDEKENPDTANVVHYLDKTFKLKDKIIVPQPLSPPCARQLGAKSADGKYLVFLDNHCLVQTGFFKRFMEVMPKYNMDMLHSTTQYYAGDNIHYEYKLTLEHNFWGGSVHVPQNADEPYRVAVGGHGGYIVRRAVFEEVGGYFEGFVGYGGEESYFDLKMWMLGKSNWLDPKLVHYHFAGARGYPRHFSDGFYRNMMMCANIIGGNAWLLTVYNSFKTWTKEKNSSTMFDLMMEAEQRSKQHAQWLASKRTKHLDELLSWFTTETIPH
jgi:predicted glycosyltransferase involved in capsule biosynthesis